jgi:hypothetical protein
MTKQRYPFLCAAWCLLLFIPAVSAQTLQIIDAEGHSSTVTAAQITGLPHYR